jgi:hypothetical protein
MGQNAGLLSAAVSGQVGVEELCTSPTLGAILGGGVCDAGGPSAAAVEPGAERSADWYSALARQYSELLSEWGAGAGIGVRRDPAADGRDAGAGAEPGAGRGHFRASVYGEPWVCVGGTTGRDEPGGAPGRERRPDEFGRQELPGDGLGRGWCVAGVDGTPAATLLGRRWDRLHQQRAGLGGVIAG